MNSYPTPPIYRVVVTIVVFVLVISTMGTLVFGYVSHPMPGFTHAGPVQFVLMGLAVLGTVWVFGRVLLLDVENRSLKTRLYMLTGTKPW